MSREVSYNGIILKRQPLGESDEIVTLFTESLGKLRVKSVGSKLVASKLQFGIQPGFLVTVTVAGNNHLRKLIGVQVSRSFPRIHREAELMQAWFVIAELLLKATPDEEPNPGLFTVTLDGLNFLEQQPASRAGEGLLQFKIDLLKAIGLGMPSSQFSSLSMDFHQLDRLVNDFLTYQLEREIKAQKFLEGNLV